MHVAPLIPRVISPIDGNRVRVETELRSARPRASRASAGPLASAARTSGYPRPIAVVSVARSKQVITWLWSTAGASNEVRWRDGEHDPFSHAPREGAKYAKENEGRALRLNRKAAIACVSRSRCLPASPRRCANRRGVIAAGRYQARSSRHHRMVRKVGDVRYAWSNRRTWSYSYGREQFRTEQCETES